MRGCDAFALLGAVLLAAAGAATPARAAVRLALVQTLYDGTGLAQAHAVVTSPDGRHVYAAGHADNALVAFSRDAATGLLSRVQVLRDGVAGVDGLRNVYSLAISPDGAHVFAGGGGDALVVFARDAATGILELVELQRDETGPIHGLDSIGSIALSPEGDHVYVTGFDTVTVFSRDAASGRLSFVEAQRVSDGAEIAHGAGAIAVSPDGKHVYVAGLALDALVIFARDPQRGSLDPVAVLRDGVGGADGLDFVSAIAISPDGRHAYVAASFDQSLAVFDRDADSGLLTFAQILRDGSGPVRGLDGPRSVAVSRDGRRVYVAGWESSSLVVFSRDMATGRIDFVDAFFDGDGAVDGLGGATQVAVSPDGANVYVAGLFDDAIAIFADGGAPRFVAAERSLEDSIDGLDGAQAMALSPGGEHLYVAGAGDLAITVFARDGASARLDLVETYSSGESGQFTRPSLAITADGAHLVVASAFQPGISVWQREPATGRLRLVQRIDRSVEGTDPDAAAAVVSASAVASSPDGGQVFVTSLLLNTLAVFDREPASGALSFRMALGDEIDGLHFPTSIAVSADGTHVYASGSGDDTVVAFRRGLGSGGLELEQVVRDGDDGVVGLRGATAMALSPDETSLYVVSGGFEFDARGAAEDALVVFARNRQDGRLSFVQALADGADGVDGLAGASSVAVLPDGSTILVAGPSDDALAVFTRHPASGEVTFDRAVRDGEGGADGLAGATSLVVSKDGRYLYVTAAADNALTVFRLIADGEMLCPGDCTADGSVSIGEIIRCVGIALGRADLAECLDCDADGSGAVEISDLIRAVTASLTDCR
jgi:6-phosphogluconolactonase (cycloisomerase 2 family)